MWVNNGAYFLNSSHDLMEYVVNIILVLDYSLIRYDFFFVFFLLSLLLQILKKK